MDTAATALDLLAAVHPALARLPFRPLGRFPTRVHRLDGVLPPAVELWVKRDDESGARYGGNKVRKLEFLLGEALARGRRRLVTVGGYGSHHVLATAIYGREAGFEVDAAVVPQPVTAHVLETVTAASSTGMRYHAAGGYATVVPLLAALRARRGSYLIAPGGSSPTGSLGYVAAGLELEGQVRAGECPPPDVIYAALGSCGTAAGLLVGLRLAGLSARVQAVQVVDGLVCNRGATLRLARRTAKLLERLGARVPEVSADDLAVDPRYFGGTYGLATPASEQAVRHAHAAAHLRLETTYTGKAFAALTDDADAGRLDGKRVMFLHTFSSADLAPLLAAAPDPSVLPARLAALFARGG